MHFTVNLKCKNASFCGIKSKLEMVTYFYWFMIIDLETNATGSILNDFKQEDHNLLTSSYVFIELIF